MCEIHYIKPLGRKINKEDIQQLTTLLRSSWSNKDGFGVTNGEHILKRETKFRNTYIDQIVNEFTDSKFILGHNRIKTNGKAKKTNAHPFVNDRFIWVHNGHISNYDELVIRHKLNGISVDSKIIGELLLKECETEEDVVKALINTLNQLSGGFSVFIYDTKEDRMFYFKHGQTFQFRILETRNGETMIIGSSDKSNLDDIYTQQDGTKLGLPMLKYKVISSFTPLDEKIYEIGTKFGKVGEFEATIECSVARVGHYGHAGWYSKNQMEDDSTVGILWTKNEIEFTLSRAFNEDIQLKKVSKKSKHKWKIICSEYASKTLNDYLYIDTNDKLKWTDLIDLVDSLYLYDYQFGKYATKDMSKKGTEDDWDTIEDSAEYYGAG